MSNDCWIWGSFGNPRTTMVTRTIGKRKRKSMVQKEMADRPAIQRKGEVEKLEEIGMAVCVRNDRLTIQGITVALKAEK